MHRQVVEIVGVAGAGKSTLARRVSSPSKCLAPFLDASRLAHLPYLFASLPTVASVLLRGALGKPQMNWREFKLVVYVAAWPRYLTRNWQPGQAAFILDQGPVYALGRLEALGKPFTESPSFRRWRRRMITAWAPVLTHLVVLDAADETLLQRIDSRSQDHETKGQAANTGYEFLRKHRSAFQRVVSEIESAGGPKALSIDSGALEAEPLARQVVAHLKPGTDREQQPR